MHPDCYTVALPYPTDRPAHPDLPLARRLIPLYLGTLTALTHDLYLALRTADCRPALNELFDAVAETRLIHFRLLGGLIRDLGADPTVRLRHDGCRVPGDPCTSNGARTLLTRCSRAAEETAASYRSLAHLTRDDAVCALLERLALDEEAWARALGCMVK